MTSSALNFRVSIPHFVTFFEVPMSAADTRSEVKNTFLHWYEASPVPNRRRARSVRTPRREVGKGFQVDRSQCLSEMDAFLGGSDIKTNFKNRSTKKCPGRQWLAPGGGRCVCHLAEFDLVLGLLACCFSHLKTLSNTIIPVGISIPLMRPGFLWRYFRSNYPGFAPPQW